jgi:type I restriction enzyme S subunit
MKRINWFGKRLGEIGDFSNGINFTGDQKGDSGGRTIKLINVKDLYADSPYIKLDDLDKITLKATSNKVSRYLVESGDLFFARSSVKRDGVGALSMARKKDDMSLHCGFVIRFRIRDQKEVNPLFLTYILRSSFYRQTIIGLSSGATITNISQESLRHLQVKIPLVSVQNKVTAVLSAYDELIENNDRRIALLEKMAEEIYREWFIRLRFPGHEQVNFHKGIPEDWEIKRLEEFCERVTDGTHDTPKPTDEGYFLVTGKNLKNGIVDFEGAYKISKQDHFNISKRSGLNPGDIVFSNIGTLGSMVMVTDDIEYSVKNVLIFKPCSKAQSVFLYYMLKEKYVLEHLLSHCSGASQQFISLTVARNFKVLDPGKSLIEILASMRCLYINKGCLWLGQILSLSKPAIAFSLASFPANSPSKTSTSTFPPA